MPTPEEFVELLDAACSGEASVRPYSGRCGDRCVAVTGPRSAVQELIAWALDGLIGEAFGLGADAVHHGKASAYQAALEKRKELAETAKLLAKPDEDAMGRGVVLYWPSLRWPEGVSEEGRD